MGWNTAAQNVLKKINNIEHGVKNAQAQPDALEGSGENQYVQGQKLPGVFKQQAKNLNKIRQDHNRYKNHIQNVQKKRQDELEQKRLQILQDFNKKAEMEEKKKRFVME